MQASLLGACEGLHDAMQIAFECQKGTYINIRIPCNKGFKCVYVYFQRIKDTFQHKLYVAY